MENVHLHAVKSFYSNRLGLVTLEDDVLSIVRQVNELYDGRVSVQLDPDTGAYHFVASEDDTDYLIFSTTELDPRCIERLMLADTHGRFHEDPYDAVEREQDALHAARDEAHREELHEAGERLLHAMKKEGLEDRLPLTVAPHASR